MDAKHPGQAARKGARHMYTSITIDNVFSREEGERKAAKLAEITKNSFYNFEFGVCPIGGSFDIVVTTQYEFTDDNNRPLFQGDAEKELLQTFVFILANQI
jgi:hypothetical protein